MAGSLLTWFERRFRACVVQKVTGSSYVLLNTFYPILYELIVLFRIVVINCYVNNCYSHRSISNGYEQNVKSRLDIIFLNRIQYFIHRPIFRLFYYRFKPIKVLNSVSLFILKGAQFKPLLEIFKF